MKTTTFLAVLLLTAANGFAEAPKISMKQARATALRRVPGGRIESSELEKENGKLIYSFDIRTSKPGVTEVNIDAMNGAVVAVHHETPAKEAAEKKQEKARKH